MGAPGSSRPTNGAAQNHFCTHHSEATERPWESAGGFGRQTLSARPSDKASPSKGEAVSRRLTDEGAFQGCTSVRPLIWPLGPPSPLWGEGK